LFFHETIVLLFPYRVRTPWVNGEEGLLAFLREKIDMKYEASSIDSCLGSQMLSSYRRKKFEKSKTMQLTAEKGRRQSINNIKRDRIHFQTKLITFVL
jgi:hypothetical protein